MLSFNKIEMKTALIICTYNRPEYLERCLESVMGLKELPTSVIIVDDGSFGIGYTLILFARLMQNIGRNTEVITKNQNKGIKDSLLRGFDAAFDNELINVSGCAPPLAVAKHDLAINLDSDAIVKPNFITRIIELKQRFPDRIISGFNCNNPRNPVLFDGDDYVERRHCNGINMAIDKQQYESIVRPALLKPTGNWDFDSTYDKPFIISKPSVVQHIGMVSSMGHQGADVACDW